MATTPPDWQTIVRTHGPMAFDTAWRLLGHAADTEDVVQDALLDAFRLHTRQAVRNWGGVLRQLAARRAIDRLRTRRRMVTMPCDSQELPAPSFEQPEAVAIQRELAERLRAAIVELSNREASVFSLCYFGEMSHGDIAETLGISTDAVAVTLHKARTKLKELLGVEATATRRPKP